MLTRRLTAHTRARTPSEEQQCTSTLSWWQAQPDTAQHSGWKEGTLGSHHGRLSANTRRGHKDAVGRYTYTYTHAQRERATGDTRPNTATGATLVQTRQLNAHTFTVRMLRRTRGTHQAACSRSLTRERSGSDTALHKKTRDTQCLDPEMLMTPKQGTGWRPLSHPSPGYI